MILQTFYLLHWPANELQFGKDAIMIVSLCSTSMLVHYICKKTKNIQKCDFMDGFCLQGELDLTLFLI